jgi:hypothetical protein
MRNSLPLLVLLLATASCGAPSSNQPRERSGSAQDSASQIAPAPAPGGNARASADSGPNVGPTAAPGVAFNYRYAFRLAAPRIAQVQEEHAQMCERLTVARCRITGMLYRVVNERDIEAMLSFKLDPAVARHFGRAGVEAVTRAEGMLAESEISGTDVGTDIQRAGRSLDEMNAELRRIEQRIADRNVAENEKSTLEYEAQRLREAIRNTRDVREAQQDTLATTPMTFNYGSGDLVPGFDSRPSLRVTLQRALDNFIDGVTILFIILVTLLPWLLAGLLLWWAFRLGRRRWQARKSAAPETEARPTPAA